MKCKKIIMAGFMILGIITCSACGSTKETESTEAELVKEESSDKEKSSAKEEKNSHGEKAIEEIREDLETSDLIPMYFGTDEDMHVEDVTLIKRNTTESTDEVYCTITVNSSTTSFRQDYKLIYNYYTTGGWILDEYTAEGEQAYFPLTGVDEFRIGLDVSDNFGSGCNYEIIDPDTDFDQEFLTDTVKVHITTEGGLFKASGTLNFRYNYLGSSWSLVDCQKENDYTEYYDFAGAWVCDYAGDGTRIRLFLVKTQEGNSLTGDYIQLQIVPSLNLINVIEEFEENPFTIQADGSVFWESQGYTGFYYDKNTVMEVDNTPFAKYSDSYMTLDEYISANYPGYSVQR